LEFAFFKTLSPGKYCFGERLGLKDNGELLEDEAGEGDSDEEGEGNKEGNPLTVGAD
jgi:hypothetical protein